MELISLRSQEPEFGDLFHIDGKIRNVIIISAYIDTDKSSHFFKED